MEIQVQSKNTEQYNIFFQWGNKTYIPKDALF